VDKANALGTHHLWWSTMASCSWK